jgi:hypothetical protein
MKKCVCCKKELQTTDFYADNIKKDGLSSYCKKCDGEITKRRKRSFIGKARSIYSDQKKASKKRGHNPPKYTRDEFINWITSQEEYNKIHKEWVDSGYDKSKAPSADRIDNLSGYSFDNIKINTWGENHYNYAKDCRNGVNCSANLGSKTVIKLDLSRNEIESYISIREAARVNNVHKSNITLCCKNPNRTCGGFKWKFKE